MIKGDMGEDYSINQEDTEKTLSNISEQVEKIKENENDLDSDEKEQK